MAVYLPTYFGVVEAPVFLHENRRPELLARSANIFAGGVYAGIIDLTAFQNECEALQQEFLMGDALLRLQGSNDAERRSIPSRMRRQAKPTWIASYQDVIDSREIPSGAFAPAVAKTDHGAWQTSL
ncbi:MAG: hypothetical protein MZU97_20340 [Bacillus subtilis]|nr:hypothetical protein [Bacillus subtilis]